VVLASVFPILWIRERRIEEQLFNMPRQKALGAVVRLCHFLILRLFHKYPPCLPVPLAD
jgi:hypothetical protein